MSANLFVVIVQCTYQHIRYVDTIVDCSRVGSATASFMALVTVAQENSTNQTTTACFGLGNSFQGQGKQGVGRPTNNRTSFFLALPNCNSCKNSQHKTRLYEHVQFVLSIPKLFSNFFSLFTGLRNQND